MAKHSATGLIKAKIWDWPTRLFHWLLVICVLSGWYFGEFRNFTTINWHFYLGYVTGGLLFFRLLWGFYGPPPARFVNIIPRRRDLTAYARHVLRRQPSGTAGHNPIGGLSVATLLILLSIQVISGFYAEDDGLFAAGPLSGHASTRWVLFATSIHHLSSTLLLYLIGLHIAAIAFYRLWKGENLITPMITGWKMIRRKD